MELFSLNLAICINQELLEEAGTIEEVVAVMHHDVVTEVLEYCDLAAIHARHPRQKCYS